MKMYLIFTIALFFSTLIPQNDFLSEQKKYERVQAAFEAKGSLVSEKLKINNIQPEQLNILIVAYKEEKVLEIFAKNKADKQYKKLVDYPICQQSGRLGPKWKQGDLQVPEGFYQIDRFNPVSTYYLSLGINYPNKADYLRSDAVDRGGDIFIHGECVTVGCLPMTNDLIQEIYLYAIQARQNGQDNIPVYIFPFRLTKENMKIHQETFKDDKVMIGFWQNLKKGYDVFSKTQKIISFEVDKNGLYIF